MPGDKRSFEERLPHVLAVERLFSAGAREADIVRTLGAEFGLTAKQVRQDVAVVRRRWAKKTGGKCDRVGVEFGKTVERRERLFFLAMQSENYGLALKVEKDRCKLLGLYPKNRTVVVIRPKPSAVADMTDAELERVARQGLKTAATQPPPQPEPEERERARPRRSRRRPARTSASRQGRPVRRFRATTPPAPPRPAADPAPLPTPPIAG